MYTNNCFGQNLRSQHLRVFKHVSYRFSPSYHGLRGDDVPVTNPSTHCVNGELQPPGLRGKDAIVSQSHSGIAFQPWRPLAVSQPGAVPTQRLSGPFYRSSSRILSAGRSADSLKTHQARGSSTMASYLACIKEQVSFGPRTTYKPLSDCLWDGRWQWIKLVTFPACSIVHVVDGCGPKGFLKIGIRWPSYITRRLSSAIWESAAVMK